MDREHERNTGESYRRQSAEKSGSPRNSFSDDSGDSSPGLGTSARDQEKYQQWYETDHPGEKVSVVSVYHALSNPAYAEIFSRIVLVAVTVVAIALGIVAIHLLPESESPLYPTTTRMNSFKKVPEELVAFTQRHSFPLDFEDATALALDSQNRVYVGGDSKIDIHSPQGEVLFTLKLRQSPTCLCVARPTEVFEHALLVGFPTGFEAYKPDAEGFFETEPFFRKTLPGVRPQLKRILSGSEALFLADAGEKLVYKMDEAGTILLHIGKRPVESWETQEMRAEESDGGAPVASAFHGEEFPGFSVPNLPFLDLAISPRDGLLYVTNPGKHRIEVFSRQGDWFEKLAWGIPSAYYEGFSGCCNPSFFVAFPDGRFATSEKFIPRLKVFDRTGRLISFIAVPEDLENPPTHLRDATTGEKIQQDFLAVETHDNPPQLAIDSEGTVVVLDPLYRAVRFYTENAKNAEHEENVPR